jgi:molybdopterin converting factor small subunit
MASVRIPTILRPSVGGAASVNAPGANVGEVLLAVAADHPEFSAVVFERDGSLKRYLAVFLGDRDVRHMRGMATPVADDAEIIVLPAASGGGG